MKKETCRVFRTAYYIAKSNRPYTDHPDLVELQELNDVNLGRVLHSNVICSDIIDHISFEMRRAVIKAMVAAMHLVQFYCTVLYCKLWTQAIASKSTSKFSQFFYATNRLPVPL